MMAEDKLNLHTYTGAYDKHTMQIATDELSKVINRQHNPVWRSIEAKMGLYRQQPKDIWGQHSTYFSHSDLPENKRISDGSYKSMNKFGDSGIVSDDPNSPSTSFQGNNSWKKSSSSTATITSEQVKDDDGHSTTDVITIDPLATPPKTIAVEKTGLDTSAVVGYNAAVESVGKTKVITLEDGEPEAGELKNEELSETVIEINSDVEITGEEKPDVITIDDADDSIVELSEDGVESKSDLKTNIVDKLDTDQQNTSSTTNKNDFQQCLSGLGFIDKRPTPLQSDPNPSETNAKVKNGKFQFDFDKTVKMNDGIEGETVNGKRKVVDDGDEANNGKKQRMDVNGKADENGVDVVNVDEDDDDGDADEGGTRYKTDNDKCFKCEYCGFLAGRKGTRTHLRKTKHTSASRVILNEEKQPVFTLNVSQLIELANLWKSRAIICPKENCSMLFQCPMMCIEHGYIHHKCSSSEYGVVDIVARGSVKVSKTSTICSECNAEFEEHSALTKHQKEAGHLPYKEKPGCSLSFLCIFCNEALKCYSALVNHKCRNVPRDRDYIAHILYHGPIVTTLRMEPYQSDDNSQFQCLRARKRVLNRLSASTNCKRMKKMILKEKQHIQNYKNAESKKNLKKGKPNRKASLKKKTKIEGLD